MTATATITTASLAAVWFPPLSSPDTESSALDALTKAILIPRSREKQCFAERNPAVRSLGTRVVRSCTSSVAVRAAPAGQRGYDQRLASTSTDQPARVPEKPTLEGLESKWSAAWERDGIYAFDRAAPRERIYSIDTPPPTVSGSLHVGHVFSYTHTDAVARYQRMRGREVFYPMGWDDNGLPTERRVQNHYRRALRPRRSLTTPASSRRRRPPRRSRCRSPAPTSSSSACG